MQLSLLYVKVIKGLVGSDVINYLELLLDKHFGPYCQLCHSAICEDRLLREGHAYSGQANWLSWQIMDVIVYSLQGFLSVMHEAVSNLTKKILIYILHGAESFLRS